MTQVIRSILNVADWPSCKHGNKRGSCKECQLEWEAEAQAEYDKEQEEYKKRDQYVFDHPEESMTNIPRKFLRCSLEAFSGAEPAKKLCLEYACSFQRNIEEYGRSRVDRGLLSYPGSLLFIGKTGCGKTHLAVATLREIVRRQNVRTFAFITTPELLLEIRSAFDGKKRQTEEDGDYVQETESDVLDKYSYCELLILDDLGAEKATPYAIQSLYLLIDRRNRDLRPTIITTNLSLEEIETTIGARIASRLSDMKVIKLNLPDYRKKR